MNKTSIPFFARIYPLYFSAIFWLLLVSAIRPSEPVTLHTQRADREVSFFKNYRESRTEKHRFFKIKNKHAKHKKARKTENPKTLIVLGIIFLVLGLLILILWAAAMAACASYAWLGANCSGGAGGAIALLLIILGVVLLVAGLKDRSKPSSD